jgi:N-acetylglucosaminyl-diphospho-decaprenol L-rhamnosyltransferase
VSATEPPQHPGSPPGAAIDVAIVTANSREMTLACVRSLLSELGLRIAIVDNGSQDGSAEALREELGERGTVIEAAEPLGFAAASNLAARAGNAPLILFLNSDILAVAGAVEALRDELDARPRAVTAGGRLVDPGTDNTQPGYRPRRFPKLASLVVVMLGIEMLWPGNPVTRSYHGTDIDESSTQSIVGQPAAAALMVRRDVFERLGGFDERFWFWFEDSDLLRRLSDEGEILWVPRAVFEHLGGASFSRWDRVAQIRSLHHGMLHYADAQFTPGEKRAMGLIAFAVSIPRIVAFALWKPREAAAWRAVARGGWALMRLRPVPPIAGPSAR